MFSVRDVVPCVSMAGSGLKLEGPQHRKTPVKRASFILFSSLQVEDFAGDSTTSKLFFAHPPLPGLPAGLKAWPIMGVLAVCVCVWVCAVY